MTGSAPNQLPAWRELQAHHDRIAPLHLRALFADGGDRFARFSLEACGLLVDYSKNRIDAGVMASLVELARQVDVEGWRAAMFAGDAVNTGESRAALHVALRHPGDTPFPTASRDVMPEVIETRRRMRALSEGVRDASVRAAGGRPIESLVHVGIGGSHLGPEMALRALAPADGPRPEVRFVSSVDATGVRAALAGLDAAATLVVVVSKSFTTAETMTNAASVVEWLRQGSDHPQQAVAAQCVAITANVDAARRFGIAEDRVLPMWDWVGGRYSLCSAVGLPLAVGAGMDVFDAMLAGAHAMDRHFVEAPLEANLPVILGLLGVWYRNFFGAPTRAVLAYDYALGGFPAYLQQLEMESAGKQTGRDGAPLAFPTCPVVWGGSGNDAQHSFFQLLHQGGVLVPCDFLVPLRGETPAPAHDDMLLANALAQAEALMRGRDAAETRLALEAAGLAGEALEERLPQCVFPGNQPSTTVLYERMTPERLGALVALYEHRLFVESICWGVNAFDQWGVELGKELAERLLGELGGAPAGAHDASTEGLMAWARRKKS
ncbi:MAG: glucose-6-phosphate isomerase [Gammaproteobacteria bacterium]|nr:glucose-6-phosphate isomerase [Gammaproteobacteria bacterium]